MDALLRPLSGQTQYDGTINLVINVVTQNLAKKKAYEHRQQARSMPKLAEAESS